MHCIHADRLMRFILYINKKRSSSGFASDTGNTQMSSWLAIERTAASLLVGVGVSNVKIIEQIQTVYSAVWITLAQTTQSPLILKCKLLESRHKTLIAC